MFGKKKSQHWGPNKILRYPQRGKRVENLNPPFEKRGGGVAARKGKKAHQKRKSSR